MSFFRRGTQEKVRVDRLWNRKQPRTTSGGTPSSSVDGPLANAPYVTYGPATASLPNSRQYVEVTTGVPSAAAQEGAYRFQSDANDLWFYNGAAWQVPMRFRVYTSLGESPSTGVSF